MNKVRGIAGQRSGEGGPASEVVEISPDRDTIERLLGGFRGTSRQPPPAFSSKKLHAILSYRLKKPVGVAAVDEEMP